MDSHVETLELTIRARHPNVEGLRPAAEAFARRVLQRCDEILEQRIPGRVFVLRHLDLSLQSVDGALEDADEIDAFAAEIAGHLERQTASADSRGDNDVVVFADEVAWRGADVEAHVLGLTGESWKFTQLHDDGESVRALLRDDRHELLCDVLLRLHRRGSLLRVLELLPQDVIGAIARAMGQPDRSVIHNHPSNIELPAAVSRFLGELVRPCSLAFGWIAIATAARDALGPGRAEADTCEVAHLGVAKLLEDPSVSAPQFESGQGPGKCASVASEFGGVFYLLRLALEVSLGESLWCTCLPEGVVLSSAVTALVGDEAVGDPAPLVLGGIPSGQVLPPISPEQQQEVSQAVFAGLVDVLMRRGLAAFCAPVLDLVETPHGRLLVASPEPCPYVLIARPGNSREEILAALDSFLAIWPLSAPAVRAGYALADLERRCRIRSRLLHSDGVELFVVRGDSLWTTALLTQAAGTLGYLFAARVGLTARSTPSDLAIRYFRVPALLTTTSETLDVQIPMEALNLDVRRAGLDADPGWIPWLRQRVTFSFNERASFSSAASKPRC
jgi:hypothetical protein